MTVSEAATNLYLPDPALVQAAMTAIGTFEQSTASVWTELDKATIVSEMRSRVQDPFQINQGGQPFCGPAAVLFELVRKQPLRYVHLCQSLFETGSFQAKTRRISASAELRRNLDRNLHTSQTDWMVLATLRESELLIFPVEPNAPDFVRNIAGMTTPWQIKGWLQELLGYSRLTYRYAFWFNDAGALNSTATIVRSGGVGIMLITAEGLLENNPPPVAFPSHWVSLLGDVVIAQNRVSFDIYTWSKRLKVDLDLPTFRKYFWATVTGS